VKDKTALHALGGLYNQTPFVPVERGADMLQVLIDLLLGNSDPAGELKGRQRPAFQFGKQFMTDGIVRCRRRTRTRRLFVFFPVHVYKIAYFWPESSGTSVYL
jgi:hypothetical protein